MSTASAAPATTPEGPRPAKVRVRVACGVYEGLLVFGVAAVASLLYGLVVRPPGDVSWGWTYQVFVLAVTAGYFAWFWSRGETLAMSTWHLRLRMASSHATVTPTRALLRFAISLLAFMPGLLTLHLAGLDTARGAWALVMGANILGYALLARLHPSRQFPHDLLTGTEVVFVPGRRLKRRGEG
ncbi:MAG: RDD family protein [Inhella sp.]|uniref:RDD family protein n=1 Tax=Inhella sp. TaxID=1921806 RepID=UPI0022BD6ECD|nr:RDD family protein [Inhella sp.]MCZ8235730.1 RDD family protein [Inhella sp.]